MTSYRVADIGKFLAKHIESHGIMRGSPVLGATSKLVSQGVVVQFPGPGYKHCTPCRTESSCSHPSARSNSSVLLWYPLDVKSWERKKTIRKLKTSN